MNMCVYGVPWIVIDSVENQIILLILLKLVQLFLQLVDSYNLTGIFLSVTDPENNTDPTDQNGVKIHWKFKCWKIGQILHMNRENSQISKCRIRIHIFQNPNFYNSGPQ